jgi:hypothetical protein
MITFRFFTLTFALTAGFFAPGAALADCSMCTTAQAAPSKLVPVTDKTDAVWLAKARADYPLNSCAVSGDKFSDSEMGSPRDFIYREAGQPDRLVRFCCKGCLKDFNKDPAKYLKIIDEAAVAKAKPAGSLPVK